MAVDPREPTTIYAGTSDRGVLKSVDGAVTWSATGLRDGVASVTIASTTPLTLFAATYQSGLLRSRDGGQTWTALAPALALGRVLVDPQLATTLYSVAAPRFEGDPAAGVFKSADGGDTWTVSLANAAIGIGPFRAVTLAMSRPDPAVAGILYAGVVFESSEFQAGYLMRSTDGGAAWDMARGGGRVWTEAGLAVDPLVPTSLYGADWTIIRSTDAGDTWSECGPADGVIALAITRHVAPTVYASTYAGVFSTDTSCGWTPLNRGLTDVLSAFGMPSTVFEVVQDPSTPATLYAATAIGVFKSTDAGANWSPAGLFQRSALASIALAPSFVIGGDASIGTVTLVTGAPEGGVTVALATEIPGVVVPATVTIGAGLNSAAFPVSTDPALTYVSGVVTATLGDATRTAWLTLRPTVVLADVSVQPSTVLAGQTATGTVTLTGPAPEGGAHVWVASSDPAVVTVATPITVPQGSTTAHFTVFTKPVSGATTVALFAAFHVSESAVLTVLPGSRLNSLTVSPGSVSSGGSSIGTVRLGAGAPVGGAVIVLSSSNPAVAAVPAAVTVPEGATSATFIISSASCTGGSVVISAGYAGDSQSAPLTVVLATDAVAVQRAEYFRKRQELRIAATSSGPSAVLQVFVASSGAAIGTLRNTGGSHSGQFAWPVNPQSILVRSSSCGSASSQVLVK